jgi:hypothetical protein
MPDSFLPPSWGPPPFDERDLDLLLSGETADIPFALRQVADALTALRAAPTQAELSGEAVIMAEFSAVTEFSAAGLSEQAAAAGGQAHTLELPAAQAAPGGVARRRGARHRSRHGARRPLSPRPRSGRPLSRRAGVVVAGAVAAVIVATAAVAASLHGPLHAQPRQTAAARSTAQPGPSGGGSAAARSASAVPTSRPSSSHAVAPFQSHPRDESSKKLCETYFGYFKHPGPKSKWATEFALFGKLSQLAGGPGQVFGYCRPFVKDMLPSDFQWPRADADGQQGQDSSGPGSQGGGKQNQGGGGPPQPIKSASPMQRP